MSDRRPRARRKSRRVEALPQSSCAPLRYTETWRAATGEELRCELYAAADDSVDCGIMHEPTRAVEVEDLPSMWPAGACEANCAQLACGHVFHPAALALHFLVGDMRCPVCRAGPVGRMLLESVPAALRPAFAAKIERVASAASAADSPEDIEQLRADITHVLANLEVGLLVLGADNATTRASARTRVIFEPGDVDAIEQQVLRAAQAGAAGTQDASALANTLTRDSGSTFGMHRSFQRLARAVVGRQVEHNAAGRVRFALVHPLVPVPISSLEISVMEVWHEFFNAPAPVPAPVSAPVSAPELGELGEPGEPGAPDAQPRPIPLFCAAVAGTHPVGFIRAHFAGAAAAPQLTAELNTLMLVNIAAYVRQVLESIRDAVELHTGFDTGGTQVEITAQAVNGLQFQL